MNVRRGKVNVRANSLLNKSLSCLQYNAHHLPVRKHHILFNAETFSLPYNAYIHTYIYRADYTHMYVCVSMNFKRIYKYDKYVSSFRAHGWESS